MNFKCDKSDTKPIFLKLLKNKQLKLTILPLLEAREMSQAIKREKATSILSRSWENCTYNLLCLFSTGSIKES